MVGQCNHSMRFSLLFAAAISAVALTGCPGEPNCRDAVQRGTELGQIGLPAEADRHGIEIACLEAFEEAWSEAVAGYCLPENGFAIGYSDAVYYRVCREEEFDRNYRLGRTLWVLEVERENIQAQIESLEAGREPAYENEPAELRSRLRMLERDIPELKTLARIQGLLDPEEIPES